MTTAPSRTAAEQARIWPSPGMRIAVVNRGDAAMRAVHAVCEINLEHGTAHRTIVLHTTEEAGARFVELADEAYDLGPARAGADGGLAYLDLVRLTEALRRTRADAAWVGWGFVAERPDFAQRCADLGVVLVGPRPEVMRGLGDKIGAKTLAESVSVPVVPWSGGPVADADDASAVAGRIGYPVLLKASAGGGGRGIRVVTGPAAMPAAFEAAGREAAAAFGDGALFVEKVVERARHVEVQVAADDAGTVWAVGTRDCTVQRRRQKIVEESGVPGVPAEVVARLRAAAVRLVRASGYTGVGTVEFLLDPATNRFWFMEVNTRLQVEHTVTEETTGLDLVKLQLELAFGARLTGHPPAPRGWAIQARVTTEDSAHGFRPAPGAVEVWEPASGPGLRFDTGFAAGDAVPPEFDPLAVKIVARGADRAEALARLRRALAQTRLVVRDGATTLGFLRALLARPELAELSHTTEWVDELTEAGALTESRVATALLLAAVVLAENEWTTRADAMFATAARGRPEAVVTPGIEVDLAADGTAHRFLVHRVGPAAYLVETRDGVVAVERMPARRETVRVRRGGEEVRATVRIGDGTVQVDLDGDSYRLRAEQAGIVRAPAPSVVVSVRVTPGQRVGEGDPVVVLESMKLETVLRAPADGVVRDVSAKANSQVPAGAPLLRIEPPAGTPAVASPARRDTVSFTPYVAAGPASVGPVAAATRLLRGFDSGSIGSGTVGSASDDAGSGDSGSGDRVAGETAGGAGRQAEAELLRWFARTCWLGVGRGYPLRGGTVSAREALVRFLRAPERSKGTVPDSFLTELAATMPAFGSPDLEPGPALHEAAYRLWRALRSHPDTAAAVRSVLRGWLAAGPLSIVEREVVENLAAAADGEPGVGDLARALLRRPGPAGHAPSADPGPGLEARVRLDYGLPASAAARRAGLAVVFDERRIAAVVGDGPALDERVAAAVGALDG
ncbi:biotin carboxylase N-terminal domain-containing protein, partial [Actinophytocola sp.]|uniref:ATP-binding protein n=1 Tax=Actinophytocola sp. TaxID=1872138 RepID=UPI003D6A3E82